MSCTCNCCPYVHKTTSLSTAGLLTVTNPNNVGNFDNFCLVMTIDPNAVITSTPVPVTITINGNNVAVWDMWGYPVTTDRLNARCRYKGKYIVPTDGTTHVTLLTVPSAPSDILRTVTSSTGTTSTSTTSTGTTSSGTTTSEG